MTGAIKKRTKIGIFWNGLAAGVNQIITFTFGLLLARLLLPEHFGLVAGIMMLTELGHSITSSGVVAALIQRNHISDEHYSTAFTVQVVLAGAVYLFLFVLSGHIGSFFRNALVGEMLVVTAISVLIIPFSSIPTAMLRRKIDFRSTGITRVGQQFSAGVTSVILAYLGWEVWSLVYGRLVGYALQAFHLAYMAKWKPRLCFSREAGRDLFSFSTKAALVNILNDIACNIDYFIIGRLLGPAQLGFYERAYALMTLPIAKISESVNMVLFSTFAAVQEDDAALRMGLLKTLYYVSIVTFPLLIGLFWVSPAFINTVYGERWLATVLPLKIMCLAGIPLSLEPIIISVIMAKGYIGLEVKRQLVYVSVLFSGVCIGSYWGIAGVSCAVLIAGILIMVILQQLLMRVIEVSWYDLGVALKPAIISCVIMSIVIFGYQNLTSPFVDMYSFSMLASSTVIGFVSYGISLLVIDPSIANSTVTKGFEELTFFRHKVLKIF